MDTVGRGAAWMLVLSKKEQCREHPARYGTPGLRSHGPSRDTLPRVQHEGVGEASNVSEEQLVEKLSGII